MLGQLVLACNLCIVCYCVDPFFGLVWGNINKSSSTVGVVCHLIVDWYTRMVFKYIGQLRVVSGPRRVLVVNRLELLLKHTSLKVGCQQ